MKTIDEYLSGIVSPFEDDEMEQSELLEIKFLQFRRDSLIDSIGKKDGYQEFDLFFDEVLSELDIGDTKLFLRDCILRLVEIYPLDVLADHIHVDNIIEDDPKSIIEFIRYIVYDKWQDSILKHLPLINISDMRDRNTISNKIKDTYILTLEKIIKDNDIPQLMRYYFYYCPKSDGVKFLLILIFRDITGVISHQLVTKTGEIK